jgi:ribose transport system ATP-binding protein
VSQAQRPLLQLRGIGKRFGGTQAVDNVTLDVHAGEILALLGENGAGKSTLIKLLAGIYRVDQGEMLFDGQPESVWRSTDPMRQPVAFIHQDLGLIEWMTVAENVALGMGFPKRFGLIDWPAAHRRAAEVMARVGCPIDPRRRVFSLTRAEKSLLAIGRALAIQARLLVLDEPSASLPMADVEHLFTVLRRLREQGMAMIYVSHRLDEVMAIADRAAVMRDGALVAQQRIVDTSEAQLVQQIVGKALHAAVPKAAGGRGATVLELDGVVAGNAGPVSLAVRQGEVLGLVGLRGAGQEAISRAVFGRESWLQGSMRLQGRAVAPRTPAEAIAAGVAYVAAERLEENLAGSMSVAENLFPHPALRPSTVPAWQRRSAEQADAMRLIRQFDVNPPSPAAEVQQLSGGNQQKVVLARWFDLHKPLTVLEEPTAGVDVGAKREIYRLLCAKADAGAAIVVVSTDFEEVATVCTRVLVFRHGRVTAELEGADINVARLLLSAAGGSSAATATTTGTPTTEPEVAA